LIFFDKNQALFVVGVLAGVGAIHDGDVRIAEL
jgi:hypothetical protein